MKRMVGYVMVFVLLMAGAAALTQIGNAQAQTPTLSTEQKQSIQILAQRIELAQLRAQAAEADFRAATGELSTLLKSLTKDGFDLNLQTMSYVKKPAPTNGTK